MKWLHVYRENFLCGKAGDRTFADEISGIEVYILEVFPESTQKYKENPRGKKCFNSFFPVFFLAEFLKGKRKIVKRRTL